MMMKRKNCKGFTLLEMIVAVGIFSIVAVLASGSAFLFHHLQRKAINAQNVHDNIRFALDTMAREIRTGDIFCDSSLSTPCVEADPVPDGTDDCDFDAGNMGGCAQFAFRESLTGMPDPTIAYRLHENIPLGIQGAIQKRIGSGSWYYITDPKRTISRLRFYASGISGDPLDTEQERITIVVEVESAYLAKPGEESKLLLQTTVTKRKTF